MLQSRLKKVYLQGRTMHKDVKDYLKLVGQVNEIDPEAAKVMLLELPGQKDLDFRLGDRLSSIFVWDKTDLGYDFWDHTANSVAANIEKKAQAKVTTVKETAAANYLKLILKVSKISYLASQYLMKEAPSLPSFSYTDSLSNAFTWEDTSQGHKYWSSIYKCLVAESK